MNSVLFFAPVLAQLEQNAYLKRADWANAFNNLPTYITIPTVILVAFVLPFVVGILLAKNLRLPDYGWKIGLVLSAVIGSIAAIFLGWPPKLGVDLKGGYIMVWKIDQEKQAEQLGTAGNRVNDRGITDDVEGLIKSLKRRLNPDGLKEISIRPYFGANEVEIIVPETDEAEIKKIKQQITSQGFLEFLILAEENTDVELFKRARQLTEQEATRRLRLVKNDKDDVVGKWVRVGTDEAKVDGIYPLRIKGSWSSLLVRNAATGELIDGNTIPADEVASAKHLIAQKIKHVEVLTKVTAKEMVNGSDLDLGGVRRSIDEKGFPEVVFAFKGEGSQRMGTLTANNLKRQLAISLDDTLLSAASIESQITSSGRITGRFTEREVDFVVGILKAGSLPATLFPEPVYEDPSDPTLGAENIKKGFEAILISLVAVFGFVAVYYRFAGFVACFALTLNILLTIAIMILSDATLTMPGLAGLVLTVGMSVDANVLIFERMREELAKGASLRMSIRNGFDRAMATIIDSNLTTLLTAIILYVIGTDQLVGFAVTLILGIVTSMFTAIFCSRVIFEVAERTGAKRSLSMMQFLTQTNIDFVKYQWVCIGASCLLIGLGLVAAFARGGGIFDIDLRGGTSVQVALREALDDSEMRKYCDIAFKDRTFNGSRVDYTLKPVKQADVAGKRTVYRVDCIHEDINEVQRWLTEALVDDKKESLLKHYRVEFEPIAGAEKQASQSGDETLFFTSLNQAEGEQAKSPETSEAKNEAKSEEKSETEPAAKTSDSADDNPPTTGDKTDADKADASKAEPSKTDAPAAKSEAPAKSEEAAPKAEAKPATPVAVPLVKSTLHFGDNAGSAEGIDAQALKTRLELAAKSLNIETLQIDLDFPGWDKKNKEIRSADWTVGLSTSANEAQQILAKMQSEMGGSPIWSSSKRIGGQIAGNFVRIAFFALLASVLGIIGYIWVRFQNLHWGLAAVLALVHDVLFMLAGIAVSYWLVGALGMLGVIEFKIDLTVIAAFLTLIGYSINDTIVVFDRMREVKGKMPNITRQVVNDSINQTLSRTFLTFFTTFMVVVVLYAAGGSGIHGFAYAMLIGTVVGCYSSIYIAAPFLLYMVENSKPTKRAA
jgi:SecD/SecF fusion protein